MTHTIRNQDGFTLVEILMSIALMAIIMAGMAVATTGSIRAGAYSRDAIAAASLLQDTIEEYRSLNPNVVFTRAGTTTDLCDATCDPSATGPKRKFNRTVTVTLDTPKRGVAEIVIMIAWPTAGGDRSITETSYACNASDCV